MLKKAIAVMVIVVLHLVAACAPAAPTPTPTPEPRPTPVEVLATKPEHLAGLWLAPPTLLGDHASLYFRFEADGTVKWDATSENLDQNPWHEGRFWFEQGVYYEDSLGCVGSYHAYLEIEGGRAVGLRFEEIEDRHPHCQERRMSRLVKFERVD